MGFGEGGRNVFQNVSPPFPNFLFSPVAPHGPAALEAETPEGESAPEQGGFLAGKSGVEAPALQETDEIGNFVHIKPGDAARLGIERGP